MLVLNKTKGPIGVISDDTMNGLPLDHLLEDQWGPEKGSEEDISDSDVPCLDQ